MTIKKSDIKSEVGLFYSLIILSAMYYVYFIRSESFPDQTYVGYTQNLDERLLKHNHCSSAHTKKYAPWKLVSYIAFDSKQKALVFEKYIKVGSGYAFAKKRLW